MSKKHRSQAGRRRSGTSQWHHMEVMTQSQRKTFLFFFFKFTVIKQITLKFINMSQIYRYTDNQQKETVAEQSSFI